MNIPFHPIPYNIYVLISILNTMCAWCPYGTATIVVFSICMSIRTDLQGMLLFERDSRIQSVAKHRETRIAPKRALLPPIFGQQLFAKLSLYKVQLWLSFFVRWKFEWSAENCVIILCEFFKETNCREMWNLICFGLQNRFWIRI